MANAIGWSREDLEAAQVVDFTTGSMLHPVHVQNNQQYNQHHAPELVNTSGERFKDGQDSPISSPPAKLATPAVAPPGASQESRTPGAEPRILGMRRTTFFLTVSNILLAIGLVVLGVVQSRVLQSNAGTPTGLEAQGACPSATSTGTSTSATTVPTCLPEANKICFATDKSITNAVAMGDVIAECPLPDNNANYTVPGTTLTFRRACETDYPSGDMGEFPVISMADCIHLCAQLNLYPASARGRCLGVSWVYADGPQGTGLSFCYPKSAMKEAQSRVATESAVLITE